MGAVMVLGPSTFLPGREEESALHVEPRKGREIIAGVLQRLGCNAFTLEGKPNHDGETKIRKFIRLARTESVDAFVIFWPNGTTLGELDVEIGHILTRIVEETIKPRNIVLVVEDLNDPLRHDEGEPALANCEDGELPYYAELVDEGCEVRRFSDLDSLGYVVASIAIEHNPARTRPKMAELVQMINPNLPKTEAADAS